MKYIRTKDGIWEFIEEYENISGDEYVSVVWVDSFRGEKVFEKEEIISQADTIEELCDEFVYCEMLITQEETMNIIKSNDYKCKEIYGAIWTDKGLIYVAKMNEKGELELI